MSCDGDAENIQKILLMSFYTR